jgi:hypothetical protein
MQWEEVGERIGYCDLTGAKDEGCHAGRPKGTWSGTANLSTCFQLCANCRRCRHVSFSRQHESCDWFQNCKETKTALSQQHRTYQVRLANGTMRNTSALVDAVEQHRRQPEASALDYFERPTRALFHQQSALEIYAYSDMPPFRTLRLDTVSGGKRATTPNDLADWQARIRKLAALPETGFGTCAVVGSSGALLEHKLGTLIDAHDAVWRVNAARVGGSAVHVGSRTDVRVWGFMNPPPRPKELGVRERILMRCPADRFVSQCWYFIPESPWPRVSPLEHRKLSLAIHGGQADRARTHPSTGAIAVWAALSVCTNVSVAGFGGCSPEGVLHYDRGRTPEGLRSQRWNITHGTSRREHDMPAEWAWLERLSRAGVLIPLGGWRFRC